MQKKVLIMSYEHFQLWTLADIIQYWDLIIFIHVDLPFTASLKFLLNAHDHSYPAHTTFSKEARRSTVKASAWTAPQSNSTCKSKYISINKRNNKQLEPTKSYFFKSIIECSLVYKTFSLENRLHFISKKVTKSLWRVTKIFHVIFFRNFSLPYYQLVFS